VRRLGVIALACAAASAIAVANGSAAANQARASIYTGYGFDACSAPSLDTLAAWEASPYRALGIYIGGINRACTQTNLTPPWVTSVVGQGWSLLPLYVGLQAPCVSQSKLQKLSTNAATATRQGAAAAQDAAGQADALGLPGDSPIYFDMEGYSTTNSACSQAVQAFVGGWNDELHALGHTAGVYGSAASTIRDLESTSSPDDVWIANWNGVTGVFGDKYVPDSLWPSHQRVHQYKGGHHETWGGVTINIDNDYVDGAVVGTAVAPPPPPPPAEGSVGSGDSLATASWQSGTFTDAVVVTLTAQSPPPAPATYAVKLAVTAADGVTPIASWPLPVDVHLVAQGTSAMPAFSSDGATWQPLKLAPGGTIPAGHDVGYVANPDGSFDIYTRLPGLIGLVPDTLPPAQPQGLAGRFVRGQLSLTWKPATDNSGTVAAYRILLDGAQLTAVDGETQDVLVHAFHPKAQTVYRVQAVDAAGNAGKPSRPLVVVPTPKPAKLPRPLPRWAWALFAWQHGHHGARPAAAPRIPPRWYWPWAAWRAAPFRVR
jgi:hypothetical protein